MRIMKRNTVKALVLILTTLFLYLFSSVEGLAKAPVEVKRHSGGTITIQSVTDTVTVIGIKLNRGNAPFGLLIGFDATKKLPQQLKFGEIMIVYPIILIKEVEMQTDQGDWTFTFN